MNRKFFALPSILLLILLCACRPPLSGPNKATPSTSPIPNDGKQSAPSERDTSVSEFLSKIPVVEEEKKAGMLLAWKAVQRHDRYRKARPSDFVTAGWNEEEFDRSYDYGEMAGAYGLAMFVVNKTLPKSQHLSFLIFIERSKSRYDIYWVYRDQNLSGLNLSRSSGDIFLHGVQEDGTPADCEIQWDKKSRKWTCN